MEQQNKQMEYEKAITYIFSMIQNGELSVGNKLPTERTIAETLNIGRNSTREALSILHGMGIINRVHGSGNYISARTNETFRQLLIMMLALGTITKKDVCEFRRTMEKATCSLLIKKGIREEHKNIFEENLKDLKNASDLNQAILDKEFHELLMKESENTLLITIMEALMTVYREWIDEVLQKADKQKKKEFHLYHEGIYHGILIGNEKDVTTFIDKHYDLIEELIEI
ncbi:MAG: FadR/GntR family transcriptional regulator [Lachnospiraceae bacterium]